MAFTRFTLLLALGALITGSFNTIVNNFATTLSAVGTEAPTTIWGKLNNEIDPVHLFDHPFIMACVMFVGEFLVLPVHFMTRRRNTNEGGTAPAASVLSGGTFWFAAPAFCDMFGTGIMYSGLCLSSASVFQMLRGSVVVFTAIVSCTWLRRKIHAYQWFAVTLVVIGITMVGLISLKNLPKGKDATGVAIGNILIVLAQIVTAVQCCIEEKLIVKYQPSPLKVVGLEGMFGLIILSPMLVPMYYIRIQDAPVENSSDAFLQIKNNPWIGFTLCFIALSIAFFNAFGVAITKEMSAAHRMVLDTMRTFVVWGFSLAVGWESFSVIQLAGFMIVCMGISIYNEVFTLKMFFTYPVEDDSARSFVGDADHGSFLGALEKTKADAIREPMTNQPRMGDC